MFTKQAKLLIASMAAIVITPVFADANAIGMLAGNESGSIAPAKATLYARLGGYDAIAAVINDTMPKLMADPTLGRFWANRGADGIKREKQLVIDFIANQAGGPVNYGGRDMVRSHKGMKIRDSDWKIFMGQLNQTLEKFKVPNREKADVAAFMESLKGTMVE